MEDVIRHTGCVGTVGTPTRSGSTAPFPRCFPHYLSSSAVSGEQQPLFTTQLFMFLAKIPLRLKQMTTLGQVKFICIFLIDVKEAQGDKPRQIQVPKLQVFDARCFPSGLFFIASQMDTRLSVADQSYYCISLGRGGGGRGVAMIHFIMNMSILGMVYMENRSNGGTAMASPVPIPSSHPCTVLHV